MHISSILGAIRSSNNVKVSLLSIFLSTTSHSKPLDANPTDTYQQNSQDRPFGTLMRLNPDYSIAREQVEVEAELSPTIFEDTEWGNQVFVGKVAPKEDIQEFLEQSTLYDSVAARWKEIPNLPLGDIDLYRPFCDVITASIERFGDPSKRKVYYPPARATILNLDASGKTKVHNTPDITVIGSGDNFAPVTPSQCMEDVDTTVYLSCVSLIDVKAICNLNVRTNYTRMGAYARQLFGWQGNRRFVYTLLMTEKFAQIHAFDRSGARYSSRINIHTQPADFIRLILGVCSANDEVVGFDTGIFWNADKSRRLINTYDAEGISVCYDLEETHPVFSRCLIVGRGTCCWLARDKNGKQYLLKDSWHSAKEPLPETDFLQRAVGIKGVCQMASFEVGTTISSLRGIPEVAIPGDAEKKIFNNRTFFRVTFEYAGKPLNRFQTAEEVLVAFRDAIAGHQRLWTSGILHRDVSINNIVIGAPGSIVGRRGTLIDLDKSILLNNGTNLPAANARIGTRPFQSINVLRSLKGNPHILPHDYLDDIESFFYVLCWLAIGYLEPNKRFKSLPKFVEQWGNANADTAAQHKYQIFLYKCVELRQVTDFFGPVFFNLLTKFRYFLLPHVIQKRIASRDDAPADPFPTFSDLKPKAVNHYKSVLQIFDETIAEHQHYQKTAIRNFPSNGLSVAQGAHKRYLETDSLNNSPSKKLKQGTRALDNPSSLSNMLIDDVHET